MRYKNAIIKIHCLLYTAFKKGLFANEYYYGIKIIDCSFNNASTAISGNLNGVIVERLEMNNVQNFIKADNLSNSNFKNIIYNNEEVIMEGKNFIKVNGGIKNCIIKDITVKTETDISFISANSLEDSEINNIEYIRFNSDVEELKKLLEKAGSLSLMKDVDDFKNEPLKIKKICERIKENIKFMDNSHTIQRLLELSIQIARNIN